MDSQDAYSNTQHLIDDATGHIDKAIGALHEIVDGEYCNHAGFGELFEGLDRDARNRVRIYPTHIRIRSLWDDLRFVMGNLLRYQDCLVALDEEAQAAYAKRKEQE